MPDSQGTKEPVKSLFMHMMEDWRTFLIFVTSILAIGWTARGTFVDVFGANSSIITRVASLEVQVQDLKRSVDAQNASNYKFDKALRYTLCRGAQIDRSKDPIGCRSILADVPEYYQLLLDR